MAGESYYYSISIVILVTSLMWIASLVSLRKGGRTVFGQSFKKDTPEYDKIIRIASNRNIFIAVTMMLIFVANLAYSISRIMRSENESASSVLTFIPIFTGVLTVIAYFIVRAQAKNYPFGK